MRGMKGRRDPPPQPNSMEIRVHPVGPPPLPSNHQRHRPPPPELRPFRRWFPWLVPSIVAANVLVFLVVMFVNDCPKNSPNSCIAPFLGRLSFQPMKENPLLGPSSDTLDKMGALDVNKIVKGNQEWRLISCIWLHAGVFHLLANMLSLVFIGIRLEQEFGFVRIGFVYVASGFGGSLLSALFIQSGISVGASGALFGLLGGMLSELITNWTMYANKLAALTTLVLIIVLNLAVGVLPHVDNFAHIGGFISGFFLGFVFLIRPQFDWVDQKSYPSRYDGPQVISKHKPYQYVLWIISLIILITGYTVGIVFLLRGDNLNNHCSWCHYLSCVPTSLWNCKSQGQVYCESTELGNQLNLTCLSTGKSNTYLLAGSNSSSQSQIQQLCSQLCG